MASTAQPAFYIMMMAGSAFFSSSPVQAAARIAESGLYICTNGSSLRFDRRGYGPVLLRDGEEIHLRQRWVFSGFRYTSRFRGHTIDIRGRGRDGEKALTLREAGEPTIECEAAPMGLTPGVVTGEVIAAEPISIPAGAQLIVQLLDIARADAAAPLLATPLLAERRITGHSSALPLAFLLRYPASSANPLARPSLSARILAPNGRLVAISDTITPLPGSPTGRNMPAKISLRAVPGRTSK